MITNIDKIKGLLYDVKYNRIEQGLGLDIEEIDQYLRYKKGALLVKLRSYYILCFHTL